MLTLRGIITLVILAVLTVIISFLLTEAIEPVISWRF